MAGQRGERTIPFAVGDEVEERSYKPGFRGAWFRTKLLQIETRGKDVHCKLDYLDYEGVTTIELYQHPPGVPPTGWKEMMLRPKFPEIQVTRNWNEGDEADYMWRNARWYGKIVQVIDDHMAMFECPTAPYGEGGLYMVALHELRPALNWSLRDGWQVPLSSPARIATKHSSRDDEDCLAAYREWDSCFRQARERCSCREKEDKPKGSSSKQ